MTPWIRILQVDYSQIRGDIKKPVIIWQTCDNMKCVNPQPCPLPLLVPRLGVSVLPYPSQPNPAPKLPTRRPRLPPGQKIATAQIVGSFSRRAPQQKVSQKLPVTTNFWPFSVKFTLAHKAVNAVEQSRSKKNRLCLEIFSPRNRRLL